MRECICPADANTIAQQALSNVRTVYSFNAEERTVNAYSGCLEQPLEVCVGCAS